MKVLFYLMATIATCNAGILGGFAGNSVQEVQVQPEQGKIIQIGHDGGYSHGGGYFNGGGYSHGGGQSEIVKVIHEPTHDLHHGHGHGHSYPTYSLKTILPQILKIILEQTGSSGGSQGASHANQLIDIYGTSGQAQTSNIGKNAGYLSSGHVVESGHIEILKVSRQNGAGSNGNQQWWQ